jgi:copper chaperone CopZ
MQTITLSIGGMTCGHCVARVRTALATVPGGVVRDVRVGSAEVVLDAATPVAAVIAAVQDAGYEAAVASTPARRAGSVRGDESDPTASGGCACCAPAPTTLARAGSTRHTSCH